VMDAMEEAMLSQEFAKEKGFARIKKVVIIVANAHSQETNNWEKKESPPGMVSQLLQSSSVPIERYSFETIELMKDKAAIAGWRRQLMVMQAQLNGMSKEKAEASIPDMEVHVMEVSFDRIADPVRRSQFMDLPTSFVLPAEDVDSLREIAGELMRQSPEYQGLLRSYDMVSDD
jgi:NTE family protein